MTPADHATSAQHGRGAARGFYRYDDIGNGQRFADQHGAEIRYVPEWKTWLVWDGQRWATDTGAVNVTALAKVTAEAIYADLDQLRIDLQAAVGDDAETKRLGDLVSSLLKHAKRTASEPGMRAMLKLAESEDGIAIKPAMLDADVHVLNTPSGIIDLCTGAVTAHDPAALCTHLTTAAYDPSAECPFWLETLALIFDRDVERIRYLQRIIGLALLGNPGERLLPVALGPGGTGMSTFFTALRRRLGEYADFGEAGAILLSRSRGGNANEDIAKLHGCRLMILPELPTGKMNTNQVKKLTGGDLISARFLYGHVFVFTPTHTFFVYTNELPEVPETGHAIWDRIRVMPFNHRFEGDGKLDRDEVDRRLDAEAAGILAWCVKGAVDYHHGGLGAEPEAVRKRTRQYRQDEDVVNRFIADHVISDPDAWTSSADIYQEYRSWWELEGGGKPETQRWLTERLEGHGIEPKRASGAAGGGRGFRGVLLRRGVTQ